MKQIRLLVAVLLLCGLGSQIQAQDYKSAIGGKLGYGLVASYKTFLNEKAALDIFGGIGWGSAFLGGVYYQHHMPIPAVEGLQWYVGGGASFWSFSVGTGYYELGVAGNIGLDYAFDNIPLNLSVDYAPTIVLLSSYDRYCPNCLGYSRFRAGYGALTARYILQR